MLETQHLRIIFGIWDLPGMPGVRNPTFTNYFLGFWTHLGCLVPEVYIYDFFLDFGPTWDVWCQKPNIYKLFLGFWTYTWDAWCWKPIFRENVPKTSIFHGLGAARSSVPDEADEVDEGKTVHDWLFGP